MMCWSISIHNQLNNIIRALKASAESKKHPEFNGENNSSRNKLDLKGGSFELHEFASVRTQMRQKMWLMVSVNLMTAVSECSKGTYGSTGGMKDAGHFRCFGLSTTV